MLRNVSKSQMLMFPKMGLMLLFLLFSLGLKAQLKLDKKVYNHGSVENWKSPDAIFTFTNTSKVPITFLPTFPSTDLYVKLPEGKIQPGESGEIVVKYYSRNKGPFTRKFEIYIDKDAKPYKLAVSGFIKSIAYNAYTTCPADLNSGKSGVAANKIEFRVIESQSQMPIAQAKLEYFNGTKRQATFFTKYNGQSVQEVKVGLYNLVVEKEGYHTVLMRDQYWSRSTDMIVITMAKDTTVKKEVSPLFAEKRDSVASLDNIFGSIIKTKEREPIEIEVSDFSESGLLNPEKFKPNNVVFLIDISNSMKHPTKLPLLKTSIKEMIAVMRDIDKITIMTYSSVVTVVVPSTPASEQEFLLGEIDKLTAQGITRGEKAVNMAYDELQKSFIADGNNQIMLATDGKFTELSKNERALYSIVRSNASAGMRMSVIGFGRDSPEADKFMKNLSRDANGHFMKIHREADVKQILIQEIKSNSLRD